MTVFRNLASNRSRAVAQAFFNTSNITTITTIGQFVQIEGAFTKTALSKNFDLNASNELVYNSVGSITVSLSGLVKVANNTDGAIALRFAKNGTTLPESEALVSATAAGAGATISVISLAEVSEGDAISLFIANTTKTTDITVDAVTYAVSD